MLLRFIGGKHIGKKRILRPLLAAAVFFLLSCKGNEKVAGTLLCQVERRDYSEEITLSGITQSENTTTLFCGEDTDGEIAYVIEDGTYVQEGDTLCIIDSPNLQKSMDDMVERQKTVEAELVKTAANYELEHAIMLANELRNEAEAQLSSLDSLQMEFSPELQRRISELNLRKASIERERYRRNMKTQEIVHNVDMQRIRTLKKAIGRRIAEQRERINALVVRAPHDGYALCADAPSGHEKLTIGTSVWERCPLIIMPDLNRMEVLLNVPENDYKRMEIDDPVTFTFSAIPDSMAWGHIIRMIPVGKDVGTGKVKLFEVTATIDSAQSVIMPQSTAQCAIRLRTMKDTLVVPSVCVYDRDSIKVVYVHHGKGLAEEREVTVAASSTNEVVIAHGVEEGEELFLLKPSDRRIRKLKI